MTGAGEFRVGEWRVHPSLNRLVRGEETVSLPSRFMDLLVFLAQRPTKVISKEEIIEAVWQKEFISEGTLTHAIAALRQTLGDEPKQPRYIETIPTRGYRLIAEVEPLVEPSSDEPSLVEPAAPGPRVLPRWLALGAAMVVVVGVTTGVLLSRPRRAASDPAAGGPLRLAVLPFANLGTPDRDYLAAGLTDDLTTRLAAIPGLGVVSRVSAESCAKTGKSASQIGEELGAGYLLTGSVRWEPDPEHGGRVSVNAQLIRTKDDTHVWADAYRRPVNNVFEIETDIASRVLEGIGVTVQGEAQERLGQRPTSNGDAYQAYLCGLRHLDFETREHLGLAAAMFERAVELDPGFALAYAELGVAHARFYKLRFDPSPERLVLAKADIDRALALHPNLPQGAMALGAYYLYGLRDYGKALDAFNRAAQGLPNDSELAALIVDVYRRQGRWREAVAESRRLVGSDPRDYVTALTLGETLTWLREYEDADRALQQAESLMPDSISPYLDRFENALLWEGPDARAERLLGDVPAPERPAALFDRFLLLFLRRDFAKALALLAGSSREAFSSSTLVGPPALLECLTRYGLRDASGVARSCGEALDVLRQGQASTSMDPRAHLALGYTAALLGRRSEASFEVGRATSLCSLASDAFEGAALLAEATRVMALAGDRDSALAGLARLMALPGPISVSLLRADARFDALRTDPRFAALLADRPPSSS